MKVAIVYEPDASLGPDPRDSARLERSQGVFIDSAKTDVLIVYREYDDRVTGGVRTCVIGSGVWENVGAKQVRAALETLGELP